MNIENDNFVAEIRKTLENELSVAAKYYYDKGNYQESLTACDLAISRIGYITSYTLLIKAESLAHLGRYNEACANSFSDEMDSCFIRGKIAYLKNNFEDARSILKGCQREDGTYCFKAEQLFNILNSYKDNIERGGILI